MFSALLQHAVETATQHPAAAGHEDGDVFGHLFHHLVPEKIGEAHLFGQTIPYFNLQIYQVAAVVLTIVIFAIVGAKMSKGLELSGVARVFGGWALWIRDEMVYPVLGKENGRKYLPLFLSMFFFIAFCNLFGLLGSPVGGTATSSIFVTGAMAGITLFFVLILGMKEQGVVAFWKHLVPPGIPFLLLPIMIPVELVGLITKHAALMIRLWANMTGGHLILIIFLGFIFLAGKALGAMAYGLSVPIIGFSAFIMIIESFVALLQAYIFTLLSIIFIGAAVHPEH